MTLVVRVSPEVEVGERLQVSQVGGQGSHSIVVEAQRLQRNEVAEFLWELTQAVLG